MSAGMTPKRHSYWHKTQVKVMFLMLKQCRCETKYSHDDCAFLRWTRTACKVVSGQFPTEQLPTGQLRTGPQPLWCMVVNIFSIQYECIHPFKVYVKTKAARLFYFMLYQVRDVGRAHILMIGTAPMVIIPNINSDVSTWKCHFLFSHQMLPGVKHYLEQKICFAADASATSLNIFTS